MLGCGESYSDKNSSSEKDATSTVSRQGSPPAIRKILCLHGGGGNAKEFENSRGVKAIKGALGSNYELVFAQAPHGGLWMRDPPEGKSKPTTDPDWASQSISILNSIVQSQGPFFMVLWVTRKVLRLYRFIFPGFQMVRFKWLPCLVGTFQLHIKGLSPI